MLAVFLCLAPRLRMIVAVLLIPSYDFMAWTGTTFTFFCTKYSFWHRTKKTIQLLWILNQKESEIGGSTNVVFGTVSASHLIWSARKLSLDGDLNLQTQLSYMDIRNLENNFEQDRECRYKGNIEALLRNCCCCGKVVSVAFSECVCVCSLCYPAC